MTMVQESQQNKKCSAADLYVVPYGRYNLMESMPLSMMKHLEDDVPPVFMILDTFDKDIKVTSMTIKILQKIHFNCLTFIFLLFMFCLVSVLISTFSVIGEYLLFPHKILHSFFWQGYLAAEFVLFSHCWFHLTLSLSLTYLNLTHFSTRV